MHVLQLAFPAIRNDEAPPITRIEFSFVPAFGSSYIALIQSRIPFMISFLVTLLYGSDIIVITTLLISDAYRRSCASSDCCSSTLRSASLRWLCDQTDRHLILLIQRAGEEHADCAEVQQLIRRGWIPFAAGNLLLRSMEVIHHRHCKMSHLRQINRAYIIG